MARPLYSLGRIREDRALTQRDLAEAAGVSTDTVSEIERGVRAAQPSTTRKLAEALGVEPSELMKEGAGMRNVERRKHAGKEFRDAFSKAVHSDFFSREGLTLGTPLGVEERDFSGFEDDPVGRFLDLFWNNEDWMPRDVAEGVSGILSENLSVMTDEELEERFDENGGPYVGTYGEAARFLYRLVRKRSGQSL